MKKNSIKEWVVLFKDGTYIELYGTNRFILEFINGHTHKPVYKVKQCFNDIDLQ